MSDSLQSNGLASEAPQFMGFSRQEYWSELLFPPPGESFWPMNRTVSLVSCVGRWGSLPLAPPQKPRNSCTTSWNPAYIFALLCEVFLVWKIWLQFCFYLHQYTCWHLPVPVFFWASCVAQLVKNPPAVWETWVWSLGWEDPPKKRRAIQSSTLAWRIPWTIRSMGL